ncbi:sulfotransferase family protein [Acuticoccus mangrovi]|uniref:Sulfotransferase n=1 Tax=Acuticoccus mangrovi TaxID=2796142 RepID=A0A934IQS0_9HYPH|nr:sulfotransferase [Acuticoccus mangrovi]MBJ3776960.1 sulfotransferase [Acuticoccus mangrovi]
MRRYPGVFFVSTGRSGSTLVSNILRDHPDILSISELLSTAGPHAFYPPRVRGTEFWRNLTEPRRIVYFSVPPASQEFLYNLNETSRYTRETLPPISTITLPHLTDKPDTLLDELSQEIRTSNKRPINEQYQILFNFLCQKYNRPLWIERSAMSILMVKSIYRLFPDAKIVHIIRDGRDVALSMSEHPAFRILTRLNERLSKFGLHLLAPKGGYGASRFYSLGDRLLESLFPYDIYASKNLRPQKTASLWNQMVAIGEAQLSKINPGQKFTLRYEDVTSDPYNTIKGLVDFMGLRAPSDWLRSAIQRPKPRASRFAILPDWKREAIQSACAPSLQRLGYPLETFRYAPQRGAQAIVAPPKVANVASPTQEHH